MKEDISKIFLSRLFELNPIEKVSKLMQSLSDFHDVTFNFLRPKVTDTGTVVTLGNFSISSGKEISLLLETIEGRTIKDYYFLYRLFKLQLEQVCLKNDDVTYGVCDVNVLHISSLSDYIYFSCLKFTGTERIVKLGDCDVISEIAEQL